MCKLLGYQRIFFAIISAVCGLIGCAIVGVAIFLYVDQAFKGMKEQMPEKAMVDIILFAAIGVGGITIIVSTFGCCGAYHESECFLGTFICCITVIVAAEVAAGVLIVGFLKWDRKEAKESLDKALVSTISKYMHAPVAADVPPHLLKIQQAFYCCGANSPEDYGKKANSDMDKKDSSKKMVKACSIKDGAGLLIKEVIERMPGEQKKGCSEKILDWAEKSELCILITCFGVALFELIAMIVANSLRLDIRRIESGHNIDT